jgi:voltage-gated potassium channel
MGSLPDAAGRLDGVPVVGPSDLAAVPLLASLSDSELAEVAGWFVMKEVGAGVQLVGEGTTGYSFFVIAHGQAAVTVRGVQPVALGPGDFFGEIALLGSLRRSATVTTTQPSRVYVLFGDDFARLRDGYPGVAAELEATMRRRLERT